MILRPVFVEESKPLWRKRRIAIASRGDLLPGRFQLAVQALKLGGCLLQPALLGLEFLNPVDQRLPVDLGELLGLVTDYDIRKTLESGADLLSLKIPEIMNPSPDVVFSDDKAIHQLATVTGSVKNGFVANLTIGI